MSDNNTTPPADGETTIVAVDARDALAFVCIRPGNQATGSILVESSANGIGRRVAAHTLRFVAGKWDTEADALGEPKIEPDDDHDAAVLEAIKAALCGGGEEQHDVHVTHPDVAELVLRGLTDAGYLIIRATTPARGEEPGATP